MIRNEKRWRTLLLALLAAMLVSALAPTQALAKTGWVKQSNGKYRYYETDDYYYYDEFAEIDGIWYRFNSNGYYLTGWYDEQDDYGDEYDGWYPVVYFKSNGAAATGWNKISGKWYYFKEYSDTWPDMLRNGAYWINKAWYVLRADGSLVDTAGWQKIISSYDGVEYTDWYYTKASGVAYTGWRKIGGSWYYFDPDSARMVGDYILEIGGKSYAFKPSGAMATGWH